MLCGRRGQAEDAEDLQLPLRASVSCPIPMRRRLGFRVSFLANCSQILGFSHGNDSLNQALAKEFVLMSEGSPIYLSSLQWLSGKITSSKTS